MIRDFFCTECDAGMREDIECGMDDHEIDLYCCDCEKTTKHQSVCNGGRNSRFRFMDWPTDPEFYRGQIKVGDVEAVDSNGEPVRRYHSGSREIGAPMDAANKYKNGSDEREEKRDKLKHATRRKRGKSPLVFDQKG